MATLTIFIIWVSRLVLVGLLGLSVWSISIIIERRRFFKSLENIESFDELLGLAKTSQKLSTLASLLEKREGVRAATLRTTLNAVLDNRQGSIEEQHLAADRAVRAYLSLQRTEFEKGLTVLATLGSNAPFIGLFGTVLGIIQAFTALSDSQSAAASVMVGISEALVATAVGLFVAIPAVVAYNYFTRKIKTFITECEAVRDSILARNWES